MKTSEKNRTIRAAEKFLAQGKIPAAISEYKRLIANDAEDFTLLNTLGDLYVRVDNKMEAVSYFSRVAEHYRRQGFALKAIAMYKKISRLTPESLEVAMNLAELYEQQRLTAEARAQYLAIADAYTRAKRTREALEMMRRIADLDPQNTDVRLRLADSFHREGLCAEAAEAYAEAGARLLARGNAERALDAYTRAVSLKPDDAQFLHGFVESHIALGTAEDAIAMLERAVADQPDNLEFLSILVRAYLAAEDAPAAERATENLVARDPESHVHFYDVARLYLRGNSLDAAVNCLSRVVETALARRTEDASLEILNEILARNPEQIDALRLVIRIYTWRRDDERAISALEHLAEVARETGDSDEERAALAQLMRLAPDNEDYRERLRVAGGLPEGLINPDLTTESERTATSFNDEIWREDEPALIERNSLEAAPVAINVNANPSFADAESVSAQVPKETTAGRDETNNLADGLYELSFTSASETAAQNENSSPVADAKNERPAAMLFEELESVDFYITQGYLDIARDTLDMLERDYGAHEEIGKRRARLSDADDAVEAGQSRASDARFFISTDSAPSSHGNSANQNPPSHRFNETPQFSTVEAESKEGAFVIATNGSDASQYEPHPETSFADLSFETNTASSPHSAQRVEATREEPISDAASRTAHQSANDSLVDASKLLSDVALDPGLAEIFDEFRHAVEEDQPVSVGDFETHYNLGLAYKEMDLLDEAIEEFQTAVNLVTPQDGTPRYLHCCNLLGHCFMMKGMARPAAMWFKKGLDAPGHTEDEYQALRYELGIAYETMGDFDRALDVFYEVYGINVSYRGVAEKLRELQAQKVAQ